MDPVEAGAAFDCFGARCAVFVIGEDPARDVAAARRRLLAWHERFTRFDPSSELSRLNADPSPVVAVSATMARLVEAAVTAAAVTAGLVDATLLGELEAAGYVSDLRTALPLPVALRLAPARRPAAASPDPRRRELRVDRAAGTITRPAGMLLDSGGLAKGLFADLLGEWLASREGFAIDCAGDLRIGGSAGVARAAHVASPFGGGVLHTFELADAGVATSGIGRRAWLDGRGAPAHHLLDPSTGRPAFTGVVQATALAPTALEAEMRAKAAVLSGPGGARAWLPDGGVIVFDDGAHEVVEAAVPARAPAATPPAARA